MPFVEIKNSNGDRELINTSTIKEIWEQVDGKVGIQFLGDSYDTYITTDTYTFDQIRELVNS